MTTTLLTLGMLYSSHLATPELDRLHPVVEYGNFMYYRNSFGVDSVAVYEKIEMDRVKLRLGLTTGYERSVNVNGQTYATPGTIAKNLTLFVVPSYEIPVTRNVGLTVAVMGNALATGLFVSF